MEVFNNTTKVVRDDLVKTIRQGSKISVASACFSIYAYQELRQQLESCDELRFIFTSPTFVSEKTPRERREFYIPRLQREKSLYGTEFEVRLRNELKQKAIARECADWIRKKVRFKTNTTRDGMNKFFVVDNNDGETYCYSPMNTFTTIDLGCERGNNISNIVTRMENPASTEFLKMFNSIWNDKERLTDVTEEVIEMIGNVYQENAPQLIYFVTLYNIFNEFLEDISEDILPDEATGFKKSVIWNKLFHFQKDAVLGIISKLEQYNGCILADSVGLGKTFTALAVIKYYESRNKNVLALCPKKLSENWLTYRGNLVNNPLSADRLSYDILYHTDLSRDSGKTIMGMSIERINWGNYGLVVIDESHNFRNGNGTNSHGGEKENRYMRLMNRVIKHGVKTKVLMLSATPVNNRFNDLRNQLALAYEGNATEFNEKLKTKSDIDTIFRHAQGIYNGWCKLPDEERTTATLLSRLDFDFFEVLDSVTIARSRKHIQSFYDITDIGTFPKRNKPVSLRPKLTTLPNAINYREIFEILMKLQLTIYTPTVYIHPSKLTKYLDKEETATFRRGREMGIRRLMSINLLKRMESSVHSFLLTVRRIESYLSETSQIIENFRKNGISRLNELSDLSALAEDFDLDDQNTDLFTVGKKIKIDLRDMDYVSWKRDIDSDIENLRLLISMVENIRPQYDCKLNELMKIIREKISRPINAGNKKILIFTAFSDTAEYLFEHISRFALKELKIHTALITGSINGRTDIPKFKADINHVLTCFSPESKDKAILYPDDKAEIDILIATDCISEGQNLQDCDYCINYDIHWNPVRIIQRFGRIDRIGSHNDVIQLVNFWPDLNLDEYINLKSRVETRMRISVMTSTGDDDLINADEKGDLEYRRNQLKRLQEEVVDLEDMTDGVSITDLGLNEFRMDLLAYRKEHSEIERMPFGIHAVVRGGRKGVIFVLKNVNENINVKKQNRLHPFYMVYVAMNGEIITNHLQSKDLLDIMRHLSMGKSVPDKKLCNSFNIATKNGKHMGKISQLLEKAIMSIIDSKSESDIESFFGGGQTTFLSEGFSGLDDFELICFMVVQ